MGLLSAVLNWLGQIPGSSFGGDSNLSDIKNPVKLWRFLAIFVQPEDTIKPADYSIDYGDIKGNKTKLEQFEVVDYIIRNFFRKLNDQVSLIEEPINWSKIIDTDLQEIERLCGLLLKIGTNSLKRSSLAYAAIEFLEPNDKSLIRSFLNLPVYNSFISDDHRSKVRSIVEDFESCSLKTRNSILLSHVNDFKKKSMPHCSSPNSKTSAKLENTQDFNIEQSKIVSSIEEIGEGSYIEEDYLKALMFENKVLQKIIYKLSS